MSMLVFAAEKVGRLVTSLGNKVLGEKTKEIMKGDPSAKPPTPGLIYTYKDTEVETFLTDARKNLIRFLGSAPSPAWELAGFGSS